MKKTKLLTSLAALALVVGLGACAEAEDETLAGDETETGDLSGAENDDDGNSGSTVAYAIVGDFVDSVWNENPATDSKYYVPAGTEHYEIDVEFKYDITYDAGFRVVEYGTWNLVAGYEDVDAASTGILGEGSDKNALVNKGATYTLTFDFGETNTIIAVQTGEANCVHVYDDTYAISTRDDRFHVQTCIYCGEELLYPHQVEDESGNCIHCSATGLNTSGLTYTEITETSDDDGSTATVAYAVSGYTMDNTFSVYVPAYHEGLPVTTIGKSSTASSASNGSAFAGSATANYLEFVSLPETITTIYPYAFANCYSLAYINFPDSLTSLGNDAFENAYALSHVYGGAGLISIGNKVFESCFSLRDFTIPGGVTTTGTNVFEKCYALDSVVIEEGVEELGNYIFSYCYGLDDVVFPSTLKKIGDYAFQNCYSLRSAEINEGLEELGDYCFSACDGLKEVTIPGSVKELKQYTFNECYNLETVNLNEGLETIGTFCFTKCYSLETVIIPSTVTTISDSAFRLCYGLKEMDLPGTIENYGKYIFYQCFSLRALTLHEGMTTIPEYLCYYCYSLESIVIPSTVTEIGQYAFDHCSSLTSITFLGNSVTTIGNYAFQYCSSLRTLIIPEGVEEMGTYQFYYCYSLTNLVLPSTLTSIGNNSFNYTYCLKNVFYSGSEEDYTEKVSIGSSGNNYYNNATRYYLDQDGSQKAEDPDGNYWYWDDNGEPAIW